MFKYFTLLSLLLFAQLFSAAAKAEPPIYGYCSYFSDRTNVVTASECKALHIDTINEKFEYDTTSPRMLLELIRFNNPDFLEVGDTNNRLYDKYYRHCLLEDDGDLKNCISQGQTITFSGRAQCYPPFIPSANSRNNGVECVAECPTGTKFVAGVGACIALTTAEDNSCEKNVLNPINVLSGEKVQSFSDFSQSSLFSFKRDYASRRHETPGIKYQKRSMKEGSTYTVKQPEGYKGPPQDFLNKENENALKKGFQQWQHNFDLRLRSYEEKGTLQVTITLGKGKTRSFKYNEATLTYDPFLADGDSLIKSDSNWIYTSPNNTYYTINALGKLINISSPNGEKLTLAYNAEDRLETVTNLHGKKLSFSYVGYLLTALTLPDNTQISYEFDKYENLISVNYPDGTKEIYHYEDLINHYALTGITGRDGIRYGNWSYNSSGIAMSSGHALGADAGTITYDGDNKTVEVTSVSGKTKKITFDSYGRVIKTIGKTCSSNGVDGTETFKYDRYGRQTEKTDVNGNKTKSLYNSKGQVYLNYKAYSSPQQTNNYIKYKAGTNLISSIRQASGLIEEFIYDDFGKVLEHKQIDGTDARLTTYQYNASGLINQVDGPRTDVQDITTYQYDENNYLSSVTNALGHKTQFADYNGFGKATRITDANGVVTNLTFDVNGRLTNMTQAGRSTSYVYDALGQIKQLTSGGTQVNYEYDAARRLTAIEDNQGNRIELTVDLAGNITQRDIKGSDKAITFTQKYVFDTINRLEKTTNATAQSWTNEYDVGSNLVKQISPDNTEVESSFDVLKRATQTLDQADSATGFEYNKLDQLTKVTDGLGRSTTYEYNRFGELTKQTSPDTGITRFTYDKAGNMLTKKDALNITTSYSYDVLNRITQVSFPDSSENITFSYDEMAAENETNRYSLGRLSKVTDSTGSTAYYYSEFGEVTKQISTLVNGVAGDEVNITEYSYNQQGAIDSITYPSGRLISYTYNSMGQVSGLTSQYHGVTQTLVSNIQYLPFGPMTSLTYGNTKTLSLTFNQNYQLTKKQINGILDKSYGFTLNGNINQITDALDTEQSQSYQYDVVERLTDADGKYGSLKYNYDAIGNRTEKTRDGVTDNYSYTNGKLMQTTAKTMNYDARGNMLQRGSDAYTYNQNGRLSTASVTTGVFEYSYNHIGQRVIKQSADIKQHFHYDLNGMVLAESDGAGNYTTEYVYLNGQRLALIHNTTTPQVDAAPIISSEIYYLHTNHIDTPLALTDQAGSLVWQVEMTPFGKTNVVIDTLTNKSITPRFPGQYHDVESGLHYNYFRDYDPELGRYIQSDPIGLAGGINTYGYVGGNPVNYVDPTGEAMTIVIVLPPIILAALIYSMMDKDSDSASSSSSRSKSQMCKTFFRGDQRGLKEFWAPGIQNGILSKEGAKNLITQEGFDSLAFDHMQWSEDSPYISITTNFATAGGYAVRSNGQVYQINLPLGMATYNNHNTASVGLPSGDRSPDDEWLVPIHIPSMFVDNGCFCEN